MLTHYLGFHARIIMIKGDKELMHKYGHQIVPAIPLT
jgi:hypothetical protein